MIGVGGVGIGVVWFGYGSGIFLSVLNQGAAYSLSELKKAGVEISSLADGFIADNGAGGLPEASFTGDPIVMIWWLSILLIILIYYLEHVMHSLWHG